jgi:hypothetical protein
MSRHFGRVAGTGTGLVLLSALLPLHAQSEGAVEVGARVRVVAAASDGALQRPLVGTVASHRVDTLVLAVAGETNPRAMPLAQVREIALFRGGGTHARTGAFVGAAAGGVALGALIYLDESSSATCRTQCTYENPAVVPMTLLGIAAGAVGGGYVGRRVGALFPAERWEVLPLDRLGVALAENGIALRLAFRR